VQTASSRAVANSGDAPARTWRRPGTSRSVWSASALPSVSLLALVGLSLIAYLPFLSTGFAATDSLPLIETSRISNLESVARLFTSPVMAGSAFTVGEVVYRPFVSLTFGLEYLVWGTEATGYHLTNLVFHLIAVAAVWRLLTSLGLSAWSSMLGAALFALHPIGVAAVPVIGRRDSVLPVAAFLAAAVLVLAAERARGRHRAVLVVVALCLTAMALLSKESAFVAVAMLPLLLAGRALADGVGLPETLKRARLAVPFVILAVCLFGLRLAVLRGMGGKGDADLALVDFSRYGVLFGAYIRDLLWAFADLAPAPREVWLRVAGLIGLGLLFTVPLLPRRQAVLATVGALWIVAFGLFCALLKITTIGWLAYFALPGVALLVGAGFEGGIAQLRMLASQVGIADRQVGPSDRQVGTPIGQVRAADRPFRTPRRTSVWRTPLSALSSALSLLGLLTFAGSSFWVSPLLHSYPQWHLAGDVEQRYVQALTTCVAAAPDAADINLQRVPASFEDTRSDTGMLGVTLIEQYTVESALRLAFPARVLTVHVASSDTLRRPGADLQFACTRLENGLEFAARY
jgi:hypothetical protein